MSSDPCYPLSNGAELEATLGMYFFMKLSPPYTKRLEMYGVLGDWGPTCWILLKCRGGRQYQVKLVKKNNYYVITTGWSIVVQVECLAQNQPVLFQFDGTSLNMCTFRYPEDREPGFAKGFDHGSGPQIEEGDVYKTPGTLITPSMQSSFDRVWEAAITRSPMYVTTVKESHVKVQHGQNKAMFFSKEYSNNVPEKKNVALRLIGSPIVTTCQLTNQSGVTRIVHGWDKFVEAHRINVGDVLIFRCYRGPNAWEMLVCIASTSNDC